MRIGVDIMGGDYFPQAPIEGAVRAQKALGDQVTLVLIGDENLILPEISRQGAEPGAFDIIHTDEYVSMTDNPTRAIATKPRATINIGIQLTREGKLDGFISAGNTGAMLVASIFGLGNIPGVLRPTIGVLFPNETGALSLLCDVGANLDCKPEMLAQFGKLGSIFMKDVLKVEKPRVALLNVGEEKGKGSATVKAAYEIMENMPMINFTGNAEGRDLYTGHADVFVCDGQTGNILLKFAESLHSILTRRYGNDDFVETFNFERYGGVPVLGINGVSIIGHGISTGLAFENMIYRSVEAAKSGLVGHIQKAFEAKA